MAQYTQTVTFQDGIAQTASGAQVNTEIVNLGTAVNDINNSQVNSAAAITDAKLSIPNRLKQTQRQGGSATDWNTTGTTTQTVTNPILQAGTVTMTSGEQAGPPLYATASVTFPTAYTNKPIVVATMTNIGATYANSILIGSITTTGFQITCEATGGQAGYVAGAVASWIAIGT